MKILILLGLGVVLSIGLLLRVIVAIIRHAVAQQGAAAAEEYRQLLASAAAVAAEVERQKRRGDEYLGIIYGIEGERDLWQKLYREQARSAGVAQAWLLRSLSDVTQIANVRSEQLRTLGKTVPDVKIDPKLSELVTEFVGHHPDVAGAQVARAPGMEKAKQLEASFQAEGSELPPDHKGSGG